MCICYLLCCLHKSRLLVWGICLVIWCLLDWFCLLGLLVKDYVIIVYCMVYYLNFNFI